MKEGKLNEPIFICGEGRSGTKLLRDTLARHSKIHFFKCETYIFVKSKIHRIKNLSLAEKSGDIDYLLNSVLACLLSKNKNIAAAKIKNKDFDGELVNIAKEIKANYDLSFDTIDVFDKAADYLTKLSKKERWLEKTPFHIYYLKEILEKYPNAKIIATVRNPKAVYASWKKKDQNKSLLGVCASWNKVATEILKVKDKYPNLLLLRFEDLIEKPDICLKELCEFIGEDFEESLMDAQVVNSKFDENKTSGFDRSIVNRWQTQLSDQEINLIDAICLENQKQLAYEAAMAKINIFDYIYQSISFIIKKIKKLFLWLKT